LLNSCYQLGGVYGLHGLGACQSVADPAYGCPCGLAGKAHGVKIQGYHAKTSVILHFLAFYTPFSGAFCVLIGV
jgi:hypothetical protein